MVLSSSIFDLYFGTFKCMECNKNLDKLGHFCWILVVPHMYGSSVVKRSIDIRMQLSQSPGQAFLWYQGRYYPLNKERITIGSDQRCDIRIENNPQVFPMHAQVISQAGQVFLQYMERGAAIWVNGSPASQQPLQDRDEIAIGDYNTRLMLLLNGNPAGADQQAMRANTGAVQNAAGTQVLASPQPLP